MIKSPLMPFYQKNALTQSILPSIFPDKTDLLFTYRYGIVQRSFQEVCMALTKRLLKKVVNGTSTTEDGNPHSLRVIGSANAKDFDPFLMLDTFDCATSSDYTKGDQWHPHRGIETITYMFDGSINNEDTLGHTECVKGGCCQWITAGCGILHNEIPVKSSHMYGFQLWLNMPASKKMMMPVCRETGPDGIPFITENGSRISVVAGSFLGKSSAIQGQCVDATILDIALDAGAIIGIPVTVKNTVFVYILEGSLSFNTENGKKSLGRGNAVLLTDGEMVDLSTTSETGARCVLFSGAPLHEPIAWGGSIVMNTAEELDQAFAELEEDRFITVEYVEE